jgi:hypothetical protein
MSVPTTTKGKTVGVLGYTRIPAQKCTIPPDDHGLTCNGYPCDMVQEKMGLDEWGNRLDD